MRVVVKTSYLYFNVVSNPPLLSDVKTEGSNNSFYEGRKFICEPLKRDFIVRERGV